MKENASQKVSEIGIKLKKLDTNDSKEIRTSSSGIPFNIYEKEWKINQNKSVFPEKISSLLDKGLSLAALLKIRITLADVVENSSASVACNVVNLIARGYLVNFTIDELKFLVAESRNNKSDIMIKNIKTFLIRFSNRYPEHKKLLDYIKKIKIRNHNSAPNIYDPEKGALTEYEHRNLAKSINQFASEVIKEYKTRYNTTDRENLKTNEFRHKFTRLIYARLLTITSRRSIQIYSLKWGDLGISDSNIRDEFSIRIPKAKIGGEFHFRHYFEEAPLPLDQFFSEELFHYKNFIISEVISKLKRKNIILTDKEILRISNYFPIIFDNNFFEEGNVQDDKIPPTKEELIALLSDSSTLFHSIKTIYTSFTLSFPEIISDRGIDILKNLGSIRVRHTLGTNLARKGYNCTTISHMLGNTPKAAKYYIDLLPEDRIEIDSKITALNILGERFFGKIIDTPEKKENLISTNDISLGEAGCNKTCRNCMSERPLYCYGCNNFRPIAAADHALIKEQADRLLEQRRQSGCDEKVLSPLKIAIKDIEATIAACNLFLAKRNLLTHNQSL